MTDEEHEAVKRLQSTIILAVSRFLSLENRLNKKPELKKCYKDTDTIHDYINKGQATKL